LRFELAQLGNHRMRGEKQVGQRLPPVTQIILWRRVNRDAVETEKIKPNFAVGRKGIVAGSARIFEKV